MAAHYHQDIVSIDLDCGVIHRSFLHRSIGKGDSNANRFGVRVFRGKDAVDLSGVSCQGFFRNSNGENIALTSYGTVEGNKAFVTLPQACYNYDGQFTLAIKLVGGGITGTMRIIDGMVDNTNTGDAVAPTGSVPTYQEILALYAEMEEATEAAEAVVTKSVRYDTEQELTDTQKAQARTNIGAADAAKAVSVESQSFTAAQKAQARENIRAADDNEVVKVVAQELNATKKAQARENIGVTAILAPMLQARMNAGAFASMQNLFSKKTNPVLDNIAITNTGGHTSNSDWETYIVPIPVIGASYAIYGTNTAETAYIVPQTRWNMYDAQGNFLSCIVDNTAALAVPNNAACAYCEISIRKINVSADYPPMVIMTDNMNIISLNDYVGQGEIIRSRKADNADTASGVLNGDSLLARMKPYYSSTSLDVNDDFSTRHGAIYYEATSRETIAAIMCGLGKRSEIEGKTITTYYRSNQKIRVALCNTSRASWGTSSKYRLFDISPLNKNSYGRFVTFDVSTAILDETDNGGAFESNEKVYLMFLLRMNNATDYAKSFDTALTAWIVDRTMLPPPVYPFEDQSGVITQWNRKVWLAYGDSITAISNGNSRDTGWAKYVNATHGFRQFYGRGIGSQAFNYRTHGGAACFINADGTYNSRNNEYNKDNYEGDIPSGTTLCRGAFCSWDRITQMIPESIKDSIDLVFIMGGTNDTLSDAELTWIPNDETDPEWAAADEYDDYGGDYNINTLVGGVASTIMKFQAWMPDALIVLGTPFGGQTNEQGHDGTGERRPGYTPDEYEKAKVIREVAYRFGIPCIDVYATCGVNTLDSPLYITDGTHPYNDAGQKMLARAVTSGLNEIAPRY